MASLKPADLQDRQPKVVALFHLRMTVPHFLAQGAIVPQVFTVEPDMFVVRWLPAMLDTKVADHVQCLARGISPCLAVLAPDQSLSPVMQAYTLFSISRSLFTDVV